LDGGGGLDASLPDGSANPGDAAPPNDGAIGFDASPPPPACAPQRTIVDLALGERHSCVVLDTGQMYCWGANEWNQIEPGSTTPQLTPVLSPHFNDIVQAESGEGHVCVLRSNGTVWCWGRGLEGQLGNGTFNSSDVPVQVGTRTDWVALTGGRAYTCARNTGGEEWCWGDNSHGQLAQGTTGGGNATPVRATTATDWTLLASRWLHLCGLRAGGQLFCWGLNTDGELGNGMLTDTGVLQTPLSTNQVADVGPGGFHTCAITSVGKLFCWGANTSGQLGLGTVTNYETLPLPVGTATDWTLVRAGRRHTCGLRTGGRLFCWGDNVNGELGLGQGVTATVPTEVVYAGWQDIEFGELFGCGVVGGDLYCWGLNADGQLGLGDTTTRYTPVPVCF